MGSANFDVDYAEVQSLLNTYQSYEGDLEEAFVLIDESLTSLAGLSTFQGAAAQSIKSYFQEVHGVLVQSLNSLAAQLSNDYAKAYYPGFESGGINETHDDARWPASVMKEASKSLKSIRDGDLADAEQCLRAAQNRFPSGISFSLPSSSVLRSSLDTQMNRTTKVRDAVGDLEGRGAALFANKESEFNTLLTSLSTALAACATGSVTLSGYNSGAFSSVVASSGLRPAVEACAADQNAHRDIVIQSKKDSISKEAARIKRAEEEALEAKKAACWWGTLASVLVLAAGAVALVATAGAASPVVFALSATTGGAGLWKSANDTIDRVEQLAHLYTDDPLADKGKNKNKAADTMVDIGKGYKNVVSLEHNYKSGKIDEALEDVDSFGGWVTDMVVDKAADKIGENLDDKSEAWFQAGYGLGKEAVDQIIEHDFSGAGMVGSLGKSVEAVADYNAERADSQLEELNTRSGVLDKVEARLENNQAHAWGAAW